MNKMKAVLNAMIASLTMLYPFIVYFGARYFEPWQIAAVLIVCLGIRLLLSYSIKHWSCPLLLLGMAYFGFAIWNDKLASLRFYPVIANAGMLLLFSWTLFFPPSFIERIARLQHPDLPLAGIIYTKKVTQAWCLFFILNGSLAFATTVWGSFELWSLYNGFIAYILMGILFIGEYLIRMRTQKHAR